MLRVNKKLEYGIIALLYLASEKDRVASVREIAKTSRIPEALLSKVMQAMKNVGLVAASHGNHGGYRLNRSLADISLLELTQVLVGPLHVTECMEPGNDTCPVRLNCNIVTPMAVINEKIIRLFTDTSLESLAMKRSVG